MDRRGATTQSIQSSQPGGLQPAPVELPWLLSSRHLLLKQLPPFIHRRNRKSSNQRCAMSNPDWRLSNECRCLNKLGWRRCEGFEVRDDVIIGRGNVDFGSCDFRVTDYHIFWYYARYLESYKWPIKPRFISVSRCLWAFSVSALAVPSPYSESNSLSIRDRPVHRR